MNEEKINFLAEYFNYPIEYIRHFLTHEAANDPQMTFIHFLFLAEKRKENSHYVEYCLLSRKGRFLRLLDEITSSVDIREAAQYIDSVEPEDDELEIIWDGNLSTKQYYLIRDYCPPLYCGTERD